MCKGQYSGEVKYKISYSNIVSEELIVWELSKNDQLRLSSRSEIDEYLNFLFKDMPYVDYFTEIDGDKVFFPPEIVFERNGLWYFFDKNEKIVQKKEY